MNQKLKAHLALAGANLIYGANYVIAKEVTPTYILPFGLVLMRVSGALLLFWALHQITIKEKVERKDLTKLAIASLFGVIINQMMFIKGISLTSPINASLIMITVPILVLIMANIAIKERITLQKGSGILMGALGALLIILMKESSPTNTSNLLGDLFIIINATSYAIYLVTIKPMMKKYHPLTVVRWIFTFGFIGVLPFGWGEFTQIDWVNMPTYVYICAAYVVVATTFFAYLFNTIALQTLNASVVGIYIYTQPIIATIIAVSLGKDSLSISKIFAAILIFMGVFLVSYKKSNYSLDSRTSNQ